MARPTSDDKYTDSTFHHVGPDYTDAGLATGQGVILWDWLCLVRYDTPIPSLPAVSATGQSGYLALLESAHSRYVLLLLSRHPAVKSKRVLT